LIAVAGWIREMASSSSFRLLKARAQMAASPFTNSVQKPKKNETEFDSVKSVV
jgi:hypothetical protein